MNYQRSTLGDWNIKQHSTLKPDLHWEAARREHKWRGAVGDFSVYTGKRRFGASVT